MVKVVKEKKETGKNQKTGKKETGKNLLKETGKKETGPKETGKKVKVKEKAKVARKAERKVERKAVRKEVRKVAKETKKKPSTTSKKVMNNKDLEEDQDKVDLKKIQKSMFMNGRVTISVNTLLKNNQSL